jgi:hypothetical protein
MFVANRTLAFENRELSASQRIAEARDTTQKFEDYARLAADTVRANKQELARLESGTATAGSRPPSTRRRSARCGRTWRSSARTPPTRANA